MKTTPQPAEPDDLLWDAVARRDRRFDGFLYYGVTTTGVYCKPTCPSPRPARRNARFFPCPDAAEAAGFRPCRRCKPEQIDLPDPDTSRILAAIEFMAQHESGIPVLQELGAHVGLSPQHLQKRFTAALGVSPQQYGAALRLAQFKQSVRDGASIAGAAYGAGFGSSSRLYEKAAAHLGMTPGRYKRQGEGMTIRYAARKTVLGCLLVAKTDFGLCSVLLGDTYPPLVAVLQTEFARAALLRDPHTLNPWLDAFAGYLNGSTRLPEFPLDVQATAFQAKVWQALRTIPHGTTLTYAALAKAIGDPNATRAVASACAKNPVALAIPCHRIVPKTGGYGGYRWDPKRKKRLLEIERLGGQE